MTAHFVILSLVPLVVGILTSVSCALLGNFLILRRQALIGDAVSHVILPGIVLAFIVTGTLAASAMLVGASIAAISALVLIDIIRRMGYIESGAAMGVVFTTLFAAGVLLLEQADTRNVHLDVEHALYGNLESIVWFGASGWQSLWDPEALSELPPSVCRLALTFMAVILFISIFWRELFISTFDPAFAKSVEARPDLISLGLVVMVAIVAVMAFEAVGAIIVVAMFICPAGAARLMTNSLISQLLWSAFFATVAAVAGYFLAAHGSLWLGFPASVSAAGMIATVSGIILAITCMIGPKRFPGGLER